MAKAMFKIPNLAMGRSAFYMNRSVASELPIQGFNISTPGVVKVQDALDQFGRGIFQMSFLGIPIRINDAILNTEARIT